MPKIVTVDQMRAIEKAADAEGHSYATMMQLAGHAVAERILFRIVSQRTASVLILVGPGNNGGDGLVVARLLHEQKPGSAINAYLLKMRGDDGDVFTAAKEAGVSLLDAAADSDRATLKSLIAEADVIVDALFGTSLRLPIKGAAAEILQTVNNGIHQRRAARPTQPYTTPADPGFTTLDHHAPVVIAVDCPSGVECDSGELDANTIPADETITFAAAKPGLLTFPSAEVVGTLHIGDIGLPDDLPELNDIQLTLVDAAEAGGRLPIRPTDSYKGTFGKALVVAGSLNYTGAAFLAASSAYRVGAGWVTVAAPQIIVPTLATMLPEATWLLLPHDMGVVNEAAVKVLRPELDKYTALLIGPGFGTEDITGEFLRELLNPQAELQHSRAMGFAPMDATDAAGVSTANLPPLVIDADGLNLLAQIDNWPDMIPPNTVLTPHPGEFARLADVTISAIQTDRVAIALEKAAEWNCVVVLKGAYTVIAAPDGRAAIQPFATSALATAGTGDVLAGAIVGLLAQDVDPVNAAVAGAWLQGMAGARAEMIFGSAASVIAGDVLDALPEAYSLAESAR